MPTFTEVGSYTVYYCAYTADNNHIDYYGDFTVTVDKAENSWTTEPSIAGWAPTEYTASALNDSGWLNNDFAITAAEGYKVSFANTADGDWKDSLTCSEETPDGSSPST